MSEILCAHCHLPCPPKGAIKLEQSQPLYFCCHGCQQVFLLLHSLNLETFYDKLDKGTLSPVTPAPSYDEARYTSKPFLQTFATPLENGDLEVALLLENIHCSACIWLIERVLLKQEGIQSVQINYTTHRAYVIFDPNATHIPHILNTIASIGYSASIYDPNTQDKRAKKEHESHYIALVVGIFSTMNVMWIAIASYAGYFSGMDSSMAFKLHIASWILSSLTLFITGAGFFRGAFYGLKHGFLGMDLGVSLGALGTYLYSIYALFKGLEPYFESVSMIIAFVFISKFLELKAKIRANSVLDGLQSSLPVQVLLLKEIEGEIQRVLISPEEVEIGARIEVLSGESVALDGVLESESAQVSTQAINGENTPTTLQKGDHILAGYTNHANAFIYQTTMPFKRSFLSQMVQLVQKSFMSKPAIQEGANKLVRYFGGVVLAIALLSFLAWWFFADAQRGLVIAISVLVVACPCAFALATPIALILGTNRAFLQGVLIKQASSLETLAKATQVFLDKTGTLTDSLSVQAQHTYAPYDPNLLLALIWHNTHPISLALSTFLQAQHARPGLALESITQEVGGLQGIYQGHILHGGSLAYLQSKGVELGNAKGDFFYSLDRQLLASFSLHAPLKPDAPKLVSQLKKMGLGVEILSGDASKEVFNIAQNLGIACQAPLSPAAKLAVIQETINAHEVVVMVGDGMNDAPSLAQSQVSICMHAGNDLSLIYSDVIVFNNRLSSVLKTFQIARRAYKIAKQNLTISLAYNALLIPCAVCGLINPPLAALSMSLSSLVVVGNSFRLRG